MILPFLMKKMNELEEKFSEKIEELKTTIECQNEEIKKIKQERMSKTENEEVFVN